MSWIALLLIGVGVADLGHSVRPVRWVPECIGALVAVLAGLCCGLTAAADLIALLVIACVVIAWGQSVRWGFGRERAGVPLLVLGVALVLALLVSSRAGTASGWLGDWLGQVPVPLLHDLDPDRALLVGGVLLVQLSTGNVLVRLVLSATGTLLPADHGAVQDPETRLKGGRLLGPMERVFILGLGLAGQLTAAAIVIAAKGLLRFPELTSRREQERIHQLTEYFLVGSFVSWLVALTSLVVLAR